MNGGGARVGPAGKPAPRELAGARAVRVPRSLRRPPLAPLPRLVSGDPLAGPPEVYDFALRRRPCRKSDASSPIPGRRVLSDHARQRREGRRQPREGRLQGRPADDRGLEVHGPQLRSGLCLRPGHSAGQRMLAELNRGAERAASRDAAGGRGRAGQGGRDARRLKARCAGLAAG